MPKIVPVKNIDPFLVDIRRPGGDYRRRQVVVNLGGLTPPLILYRRSRFPFKLIFSVLVVILGGAIFWVGLNFKQITADWEAKAALVIANFSTSLKSLKEFKPGQASAYLRENEILLANLVGILNRYGSQRIMETAAKVAPEVGEARALVDEIQVLNRATLKAAEILDDLRLKGFVYFQNDGMTFLNRLGELKDILGDLIRKGEAVQKRTAALRGLSPALDEIGALVGAHYFNHQPELHRWERFLAGLLNLLNREEDIHFLLLFQNPSEIRPGGGFIGSYADVIVRRGQLYFIDVRDIYDPEGQLDLRVVPPQPLQATTHIWGARDANWFFDFPASALKVSYFLESSKIYDEQKIKFEKVVALNIRVIESILKLIGPVPLEDYKLTINENNFLKEVQREVEAGEDKKAGYPKRILKILTPILLERMRNLDADGQVALAEAILNHIERKDIMFFAKDKALQDFFVAQGIAGAVLSLPYNFLGHYLAVVNANIEGGKSDAFIKQEIEAEIVMDSRGGSAVNLIVRRAHTGDKEKELWWRKENQNYLQVLTNPGSSLVALKGNNNPPPKFREINYELQGYQTDVDVSAIEQKNVFLNDYKTWVGQAFGKTVFGTWFTVPAGKTKELELRYQTPPATGGIEPGKTYEFIYEKQSGVETRLKVTVHAPFGYRFQENNSSIFFFNEEVKEGRFIQKLTLTPAN